MHPNAHAETTPDKAALILSTTGETVSYRDLQARADRMAHAFRRLGLANGDTMALIGDNRPEFLDVYWAAQRSGLVLVPVSSRLKPDEIAYIVNDSTTKLALFGDTLAETARGLAAIRAEMPGLAEIATLGPVDGFPDLLALAAAEPAGRIADARIGGCMTYSSGTTGRPKGIRYAPADGPPEQPNPGAMLFGQLYTLGPDTIYLSPAPLYHSAPLGMTAAVQALGGTVVLMPKFDPEQFLAASRPSGASTCSTVAPVAPIAIPAGRSPTIRSTTSAWLKEPTSGGGRFKPTSVALRYAFKTPTLREVGQRAPYMHDGSVPNLEAVIDLYDRGGIDRPSRSRLIKPLHLIATERSDLLAFLATLSARTERDLVTASFSTQPPTP